jgi:hypothetical protein
LSAYPRRRSGRLCGIIVPASTSLPEGLHRVMVEVNLKPQGKAVGGNAAKVFNLN